MGPSPRDWPFQMPFEDIKSLPQSCFIVEILRFELGYYWGCWESAGDVEMGPVPKYRRFQLALIDTKSPPQFCLVAEILRFEWGCFWRILETGKSQPVKIFGYEFFPAGKSESVSRGSALPSALRGYQGFSSIPPGSREKSLFLGPPSRGAFRRYAFSMSGHVRGFPQSFNMGIWSLSEPHIILPDFRGAQKEYRPAEWEPGVPQGSIGDFSILTVFIKTWQLLIATPWGLEPENELIYTFPAISVSSLGDQYWRKDMTLLLTHFQASKGAFQGISQRNHGGDVMIDLGWENLVPSASQKCFSSSCDISGAILSFFWLSAWKNDFQSFLTYGDEFASRSRYL